MYESKKTVTIKFVMEGFIVQICIDSREKDRKDRANLFYSGKGHDTYITTLDVGDYLFEDKVVFEYKEISDFMSSIVNESLFNEATNQALRYPFHYVIVVGDVKQYCDDSWIYLKNKWRNDYPKFLSTYYGRYYGALRRLRTFTTPIVCKNEKNAFFEMLLQAIKCLDGKSKFYSNVTRQVESQDPTDILLCSAKNISVKKAEAIRKHHTINNIYDLMELSVKDFEEVEGMGKITSSNLYSFLHMGCN